MGNDGNDREPLSWVYLTATGVVSDEAIVLHSILFRSANTGDKVTLHAGQSASDNVFAEFGFGTREPAFGWSSERGIKVDTGLYAVFASTTASITLGFRYLKRE